MIKKWILAARPRTLLVSVSPVVVASAFCYFDGVLKIGPAFVCLFFALLAQVASNFANDYYDYKKGSDRSDRTGPRRAVASGDIRPKDMLKATLFTLFVACALGSTLIYYGGWELIVAGVLIAIFALAYSAGPYPLSYHGWGDVAVFVFFGLVAVNLTYYVQALTFTWPVFLGSVSVGLLSINVLMVNNYRDMEEDKISNKKTVVVRFGRRFAAVAYLLNGVVAVAILGKQWELLSYYGAIMPILFLWLHVKTWQSMMRLEGVALNAVLGRTARNLFLFTCILVATLVLGKWF